MAKLFHLLLCFKINEITLWFHPRIHSNFLPLLHYLFQFHLTNFLTFIFIVLIPRHLFLVAIIIFQLQVLFQILISLDHSLFIYFLIFHQINPVLLNVLPLIFICNLFFIKHHLFLILMQTKAIYTVFPKLLSIRRLIPVQYLQY